MADINRVPKGFPAPKFNLNEAEVPGTIGNLKRDWDRLVQTGDKGVAMLKMDRQDYINKSNKLFKLNQPTGLYPQGPHLTKIKAKLINILKKG